MNFHTFGIRAQATRNLCNWNRALFQQSIGGNTRLAQLNLFPARHP